MQGIQKKIKKEKANGLEEKQNSQGKPKGLKQLKLPTPKIWTNQPQCQIFVSYLKDIGQHFSYHAAGSRQKANQQIETIETPNQEIKKPIVDGNEVATRVAEELFFYKSLSPKQVIYFFRQQYDPILSQQEIIKFIKAKFQDEIQKNNDLQALAQPQKLYQIPNHPMQIENLFEDHSSDHHQSKYQFKQEQKNIQIQRNSQNFNQQYSEKLEQYNEFITNEQQINMTQKQNQYGYSQAHNQVQDCDNPFLLEFIDPDLAIVLNKMYFLLNKNFIFELILILFAQKHDLNVLDVLTFGKHQPKDYPQIIKNAYISEVISFTNDKQSKFYQEIKLQQLKQDFNEFIKKQENQAIINEKINILVQCLKSNQSHQNDEYEDQGNAIQGELCNEKNFFQYMAFNRDY